MKLWAYSQLAECKRLAHKGDTNGARMVANQVARYRRLHDRNLESSIMIGTKMQSMVSDHKVNRAEVETIKGFTYANMYESFARTESREQRYAWRMNAVNHLETSMRDTMDEVYKADIDTGVRGEDGDGPAEEAYQAQAMEMEMQTILQQAMGGVKLRVYQPVVYPQQQIQTPFIINLRLLDSGSRGGVKGASLTLNPIVNGVCSNPSFNVNTTTIDSLKRLIVQDRYVCGQLELSYNNGEAIKGFQLGRIDLDSAEYQHFEFSDSLKACDILNGDTLWVRADDVFVTTESSAGNNDIEERLSRMRLDLRRSQK